MQSIIIIIPTKVGGEGITSTLMNITDKERGNRMPSKPQVIYEDKDFNNTLDLLSRLKIQCLAQQSISPSKAEEIIKATEHLWTRYRCHGDKINEGYGCESCNYAARYLAENTDNQIKFMIMEKLDSPYSAGKYDNYLKKLICYIVDEYLYPGFLDLIDEKSDDMTMYAIEKDLSYRTLDSFEEKLKTNKSIELKISL